MKHKKSYKKLFITFMLVLFSLSFLPNNEGTEVGDRGGEVESIIAPNTFSEEV